MLVTDDFVFVHIPKTGGSFIQAVIREHLPVVDYRVWTHTPYAEIPKRWRHLPAFCVVRNPWDWYVSWFCYQAETGPRRRPAKRAFWEGVLRSGEADFKEAITRACTGGFDDRAAPMFRGGDLDLYSARVKTIAGTGLDRPNFTVLRFEQLRRDLLRFLGAHVDVPKSLRAAIRRDPPKRASDHGPYHGYYDDELAELVGDRTRWLCERFDYKFKRRSHQLA